MTRLRRRQVSQLCRWGAARLLPWGWLAGALALAAVLAGCREQSQPAVPAGSYPAGVEHETFAVAGLREPVEILVDRWGVAHIYARNEDDLFLAQGWNAARDRLWQLDLWKRRGDGTLAEALGPEHVAKDRAARLLLYRGDLYPEWLAYAGDTKRIVSAFVAGLNAWIELTAERPELLAPEFRLLDYRPARWTPETVVRIRSHGLLRNARSEVARARFLDRHGPEALQLRDRYEPSHELLVPAELELAVFDAETLADYELGTGPVSWPSQESEPLETLPAPGLEAERDGSNNWAIAPARTTTGRPILANDPHRALEIPSLRYLVHLSSPTLEVAGAGEPALPGVSLGHNGTIAFGFTIFSMDQEDLYVHRTRPGRPGPGGASTPPEYWYAGGWERMSEVRERIPVRGGDAAGEEVVLRFTRYGPVLHEDPQRGLAVSLRAAWLEPGMAPYLASLAVQRARDWDGFLGALNRWGLPGENLVYADVAGRIGWKPAGRAPRRVGWDGLLPVPGDGRYEWSGYLDGDELPVEVDPERGWVATANQMNLPSGYARAVGYEWAPPFRQERIAEVLRERERTSVEQAARLQTDTVSTAARRLLARLAGLEGDDERERRALGLLREWDGRVEASSAAAALFEVWKAKHLPAAFWAAVARARGLGGEAGEALAGSSIAALFAAMGVLDVPDAAAAGSSTAMDGGEDRTRAGRSVLTPAALDDVLVASLGAAAAEVEERLGPDWSAWRWGSLHHSRFEHPLSPALQARLGLEGDVGPLARSGSGETPLAAPYRSSDFRQLAGASVRLVLDVGAWDGSLAMNSPGQSGVPGSRHYGDLFAPWAADESFPFLWTRPRIEAETERVLRLEPR